MQPVAIASGETDEDTDDYAVELGHQGVLEARRMTGRAPQLLEHRTRSALGPCHRTVGLRCRVIHQPSHGIVPVAVPNRDVGCW